MLNVKTATYQPEKMYSYQHFLHDYKMSPFLWFIDFYLFPPLNLLLYDIFYLFVSMNLNWINHVPFDLLPLLLNDMFWIDKSRVLHYSLHCILLIFIVYCHCSSLYINNLRLAQSDVTQIDSPNRLHIQLEYFAVLYSNQYGDLGNWNIWLNESTTMHALV